MKYSYSINTCAWAWACLLLLCGSNVHCCGPGRSGGRRRSPRKLTPLVFKQQIPNVAENTLGASGLTEGRITRDDPRFHDLVPNYNADVYFRDEEGTGADRFMTERCKEKLNMLSITVMNQWPGIKLRVVEGWDEEKLHAKQSLHYEGRAVDLSTSDKDRSKLGMLARFAVEAGFDWVYYESRNFIHCSVKSETSASSRLGGCFPSTGKVMTPNGIKELAHISEGDMVQVMKLDGSLMFSPVIMFLHKDPKSFRTFLTVKTESGQALSLTSSHLLMHLNKGDVGSGVPNVNDLMARGSVVMSGTLQIGDYVLVVSGNRTYVDKVIDIDVLQSVGVFAPLTYEGTVVIDNVVASCYAVINSQDIAHWAFLPVRAYYHLKDYIWYTLQSLNIVSIENKSQPNAVDNSLILNVLRKNNTKIKQIDSNSLDKSEIIDKYELYKRSQEEEPHIHWYPKFLYRVASWFLPSVLIHS